MIEVKITGFLSENICRSEIFSFDNIYEAADMAADIVGEWESIGDIDYADWEFVDENKVLTLIRIPI